MCMKKITRRFLFLSLIAMAWACDPVIDNPDPGPDPGKDPEPIVNPVDSTEVKTYAFSVALDAPNEDERMLVVAAENDKWFYGRVTTDMPEWKVSSDAPEWCEATKWEGGSFAIHISPNTSSEARTAVVRFVGTAGTKVLTDSLMFRQVATQQPDLPDSLSCELSPGTMWMGDASAAYITRLDTAANVVTFAAGTPEEYLPRGYNYLVCPVVNEVIPEGILGIINSCQTEADGSCTVRYTPCELNKVFSSMDLETGPIDLGGRVTSIVDAGGNDIQYVRTRATSSDHLDIHIPKTVFRNWDQTVLMTAAVDMTLDMSMSLQIYDGAIQYFALKLDPDLSLTLDMEANIQGEAVSESYPFFTVLCGAFPAGPVVLTPLVEVSFIIGADGKIGLTAGVTCRKTTKVMFAYQRGAGQDILTLEDDSPTDQKNKTELRGTAFMEGALSAGLDTSIGMGVYGTILYNTVGLQERVKTSARLDLDLAKIASESYFTASSAMLRTDLTLQGVVALKSLGATFCDFKGLEHNMLTLDSLYLFPTMRARATEVSATAAQIEVEVGRDLLMAGDVGLAVYAVAPDNEMYHKLDGQLTANGGKDRPARIATYHIGNHHRLPLEPTRTDDYGNPVSVITYTIPLDILSGEYYVAPIFTLEGYSFEYLRDGCHFYAVSGAEAAFRAILMDLSKSFNPDEMNVSYTLKNWGTTASIASWSGVDIDYENNLPVMTVTVEAPLVGDIHIGNHTQGIDCRWKLLLYTMESQAQVLDIQEAHLASFSGNNVLSKLKEVVLSSSLPTVEFSLDDYSSSSQWNNLFKSVEKFTLVGDNPWLKKFHTGHPYYPERGGKLPALKELVIDGATALTEVGIVGSPMLEKMTITPASPSKITSIYLSDAGKAASLLGSIKSLKNLYLHNSDADAPALTISGLPSLESLTVTGDSLNSLTVSNAFSKEASLDLHDIAARNVSIDGCNMRKIYSKNSINAATGYRESLSLKGCPNLTEVAISNSDYADRVVVSNMPALSRLIVSCGASSMELGGLPNVAYLDICKNRIPAQVVWPLFDEIRLRAWNTSMSEPGQDEDMQRYNAVLAAEGSVSYDQVYEYYGRGDYSESDYGFYYSDEPDCGYHWNPSRIGKE